MAMPIVKKAAAPLVTGALSGLAQPPPQALRFSHRRGERETRVTGVEPQGSMGRVQTAGELPAFLCAHVLKRDVWVRGRGLASLGVDKIFGKGQRGGFLIPMDKIAHLVAYKHLLTTGQKKDILKSLQTGNGLVIRPTKTQRGGFLGTLLASIGVPLLLNALTGKGLQADRTGSANTTSVYVPDTTNGHGMYNPYPYMSPPFFRTWENPVGMGVKKKKEGKGTAARRKQPIQFNPNSRNNTIRFINKPLSNIDLIQ